MHTQIILLRTVAIAAILSMSTSITYAQQQIVEKTVKQSFKDIKIPDNFATAPSTSSPSFMAVKKAPVNNISSLAGHSVIRNWSGINSVGYGGNQAEITVINSTTLEIEHFTNDATQKIKVNVDLARQKFSIPAGQLLYTYNSVNYYLCAITIANNNAYPNFSAPIEGIINEYGLMQIETIWSDVGMDANSYYSSGFIWQWSLFYPSNAVMQDTYTVNYHDFESYTTSESYYVYVEQNAKRDSVYVLNFGNHGQAIGIKVNETKTISIPSQLVYDVHDQEEFYDNGDPLRDFYTSGGTEKGTAISGTISSTSINFGNWSMIDVNGWGLLYASGKITLTSGSFGFPSSEQIYITVSPSSLAFSAEKQTYRDAYVNSNTSWITSSDQSWLKCSPSESSGSQTSAYLTITVEENTSAQKRTGTITVSTKYSPVVSRTITVTQEGRQNRDIVYTPNGSLVKYTLHTLDNTATVDNVEGDGADVDVPETVTYDGGNYSVTEVGEGALASEGFNLSVTFPSTIISVKPKAFDDAQVSAIVWNSISPIPSDAISKSNDNKDDPWKNRLLYVKKDGIAPDGFSNIIVDGRIQKLEIYDGYVFHCPQDFIAQEVSYTHEFTMETAVGVKQGWESIVLPFAVQKITHATKGNLVPFSSYNSSSGNKPFWLYEWTSSGFTRSPSIEANKPYLISMPNSSDYPSEYNLAGRVTFSAVNALVRATVEEDINSSKLYKGKGFFPSYYYKDPHKEIYNLNTGNGYAPGSVFINNARSTRPFEGFIGTISESGSSRGVLEIEFAPGEDTQGIDNILTGTTNNTRTRGIYTIAGQRVANGTIEMHSMPSGIYIVDGKKKIVP